MGQIIISIFFSGDAFIQHTGVQFSTKDEDNDTDGQLNYATIHHGAWWYDMFYLANLNGAFLGGANTNGSIAIIWAPWKGNGYSVMCEMKIRRV